MSRWKAFSIHLILSAVIALLFLLVCRYVWYAGPLFEVSGAEGLLSLLIPIDVVLGPFLTLLVFKAGKPSLKFDLSVIGFVQLAALLYGAHIMLQARPLYGVFYYHDLRMVRALDTESEWFDPILTQTKYVVIPESEGALPEIEDQVSALTGDKSIFLQRERYQSVANISEQVLKAIMDPKRVKQDSLRVEIDAKAKTFSITEYGVIKIFGRDGVFYGIVDKSNGEIFAFVPI